MSVLCSIISIVIWCPWFGVIFNSDRRCAVHWGDHCIWTGCWKCHIKGLAIVCDVIITQVHCDSCTRCAGYDRCGTTHNTIIIKPCYCCTITCIKAKIDISLCRSARRDCQSRSAIFIHYDICKGKLWLRLVVYYGCCDILVTNS